MEPVSFVIYDKEDGTYHQGGGEWEEDRLSAVHYDTGKEAQQELEDCDQEAILRHRLEVVPEGTLLSDPLHLAATLTEIARERDAQDRQWGGVEHDDKNRPWDWLTYISKHIGKAVVYPPDSKQALVVFRRELVKVASLAVAAIQAIDRRLEGDALAQTLRQAND